MEKTMTHFIVTMLLYAAFFLPPWGGQRSAFAQNYQWAKGLGAGHDDNGRAIAVDDSGNVYVAGEFTKLLEPKYFLISL